LKKGRIDSFIFSGGVGGGGAATEAAPVVAGLKLSVSFILLKN
jgi:hypothetical protein